VLPRYFARSCIVVICLMSLCTAQQTSQVQSEKEQGSTTDNEKMESKRANLNRLPIELVIGPYIPVQEPLHPAGLLVYVTFCWKCLQELDFPAREDPGSCTSRSG
jgi:hypothetical protein